MLIFQLVSSSTVKKNINSLRQKKKRILDTEVWTTNTIVYFSHSLIGLDCFHVAELLNAHKFAAPFSTHIPSKSKSN